MKSPALQTHYLTDKLREAVDTEKDANAKRLAKMIRNKYQQKE